MQDNMTGTLYTYPDNFRAQKILIAAEYSGTKVELAKFDAGETNKTPEFLKKFPLGKVPVFESDGMTLFEPNAIAFYVGSDEIRGGHNEAEVLQWIEFADNDVLPAACTWVYPTLGVMQHNKNATEKAKEDIKNVMGILNEHLQTRTFLVGERVTQADISLACTMLMLYCNVLDPQFRSPYGNVNRWFLTVVNQPQCKAVLGEVKLCSEMAQFDAKKFSEISGKSKKEQASKKKAAKSEAKPQEAGEPAASKTSPSAEPVKKEKKDPWASCPEPTFDMEAWKRFYSNNDGETSFKYFLENFPKESYSVWRGEYKYNDELKMSFMADNLVRGCMQRLEKMRKHAFGVINVLEKDGLMIDGIWMWLGQGLAFELSEDWQIDYDIFKWTKLDIDDENAKSMIKKCWNEENEIDGKAIVGGGVYK